MSIDEHIKNLEKYCEDDDLFEKDGDFKEFCDNHIADIKAIIEEIEQKNRIIDLMAEDLKTPVNSKEWIIEYYKKRCKNAKD